MRYSNQAPWKSVRLGYLALNASRASTAAALSANEPYNHTVHCFFRIECDCCVVTLSVQPVFQAFSIRFHTEAAYYYAVILQSAYRKRLSPFPDERRLYL